MLQVAAEQFGVSWSPLQLEAPLSELVDKLLREKYSQAAFNQSR